MNQFDRFWRLAFRSAYLNSIEQAGLRDLVERWEQRGLADRDYAAIPSMQDDGSARLVKLTIHWVEAYAAAYHARLPWTAQQFSFPAGA